MDRANKGNKIKLILQKCIETSTACVTICKSIHQKEGLYTKDDCINACNLCLEACKVAILECQEHIKNTNDQQHSSILEECINSCNDHIYNCNLCIKECSIETNDNGCISICEKCVITGTRFIENCIKASLIDYNERQ